MDELTATVVKNAGSHYLLSRLPVWDPFPAVLRGKVRLQKGVITNPVAVGDIVRYALPPGNKGSKVLPSEQARRVIPGASNA